MNNLSNNGKEIIDILCEIEGLSIETICFTFAELNNKVNGEEEFLKALKKYNPKDLTIEIIEEEMNKIETIPSDIEEIDYEEILNKIQEDSQKLNTINTENNEEDKK